MIDGSDSRFCPPNAFAFAFTGTADFDCTTVFKDQSYARRIYNNDLVNNCAIKVQYLGGNTVTINIAAAQWHDGIFGKILYTGTTLPAGGILLQQ